MNCPRCGGEFSSVVESRKRLGRIYRRRHCVKCNGRWTTYEFSAEAIAKIKNSHEQAIQEINDLMSEPVSNPNKLD